MSDYETIRQQHVQLYSELQPQYFDRVEWPRERLQQEREGHLRALIRVAKERSPWHAKRLAHLDCDRLTEADLPSIPPMTKQDMMENFDEVLTDSRLNRGAVEAHLEGLTDDAYMLDEFHAVASGGSSGTRGVFVYGWDAWAIAHLTFVRFRRRMMQADPTIGISAPAAMVAAGKATHMTYAMSRTFGRSSNVTAIPAVLPLPEIVSRLNALQPLALNGYPTMLYALAQEALAGRLRVTPRIVGPGSEPLLPEMRARISEAWDCPILNVLGTSEGVAAGGCGESRGMHLGEDAAIFELVDEGGLPVPPGVRAAKMYVTNLYNHVQPLIRYELTDEATLIDEPCPCGSAMRRIDDIEGRADDVFTYATSLLVHPILFRSRLGHERNIVEYQVRQTAAGADIDVRLLGPVDMPALGASLERDLVQAGLPSARITLKNVEKLDRQQTGKLKRFVPLPVESSTTA